jgi:hypothetical protein
MMSSVATSLKRLRPRRPSRAVADEISSTSPPKAPAPTGVSPAADAAELAKGMEGIRSLLQRTGAALGAGATALLTALGLTEAYELFPLPQDLSGFEQLVLVIGAGLGAVAALGGAAWLTSRFFWAQRRILLDSTGLRGEDDKGEKKLVKRVLDEHAREQLAHTLQDVERRALRLERIARRRRESAESPNPIKQEADYLGEFVSIALSRAAAVLLERRARNVFRGLWTATALATTIAGLLVVFALGDYTKGQRDLVELRKTCSEAKPSANACATVVSESDATAAQQEADKAAETALREARRIIDDYQPTGSPSNRASAAAKLMAACTTLSKAQAPDIAQAELTRAVTTCIRAARS